MQNLIYLGQKMARLLHIVGHYGNTTFTGPTGSLQWIKLSKLGSVQVHRLDNNISYSPIIGVDIIISMFLGSYSDISYFMSIPFS